MDHKDSVARYVRLGLVAVAFALIGSIVAAPLLRPAWTPHAVIAYR